MQVAHARKVRDVAPLACKSDKVDARVLAELCRRELVPELWIASLDDRALRERLRRRMHLVRMRASAMNRIFGLQTQWGLRISLQRLRAPDAMSVLDRQGMPAVWRRSIIEALEVIELLDARITPLDHELGPLARADARVALLDTIPGVGDLLALTLASEIGDIARFSCARKLIGYAGLAPKINQSGDRSRTGALSKGRIADPALDGDLLARRLRQRQAVQPLASVGGHQRSALRAAVVIEHRLNPLLPLATLSGQGVTQPHTRAQIQQVRRRDPRLRQPPDHQQLAQMPRVGAVGLGTLLVAAPRARLRRLGQMRPGTDRVQLLDHKPPARRRLQRHLELPAAETAQKLPDALAVRRRTRARPISPVAVSIHSAVICARC